MASCAALCLTSSTLAANEVHRVKDKHDNGDGEQAENDHKSGSAQKLDPVEDGFDKIGHFF